MSTFEVPDDFVFKNSLEHISPKRVGVVLDGLETALGDLKPYVLSETEFESMGDINKQSVADMDEPTAAHFLHEFLKKIQSGAVEADRLQEHTMFKAVVNKALQLRELQ